MLRYYLQLGLRSLKRNPMLTGLMVMAIGFGVAASMITYSVFRAVSGDPIPQKSSQLFTYEIDSWGPQRFAQGKLPEALNYTDADALLRAQPASKQTVLYPVRLSAMRMGVDRFPAMSLGYAVTSDFFGMFDVPFQYGSGWSRADDDNRADEVVLSADFNQREFGGANSIGKEVQLNGHSYRVVGVTQPWQPQPAFFDAWDGDGFGDPWDFYIPLRRAIDLHVDTGGNTSCRGVRQSQGYEDFLRGTCIWLSPWVELDSAADVHKFSDYLHGYAEDQQHAGRYTWAPKTKMFDVMQWLSEQHIVPAESRIALVVSLCFLLICLVNTIGLLLAKFMRRAPEIGVRRALGAPRAEIYKQYLMEGAAVGIAGGVLGLLLTAAGMSSVGILFEPDIAALAHLDGVLVAMTLLIALFAAVLAAFYPAWRAAQVQPAWQLKSN